MRVNPKIHLLLWLVAKFQHHPVVLRLSECYLLDLSLNQTLKVAKQDSGLTHLFMLPLDRNSGSASRKLVRVVRVVRVGSVGSVGSVVRVGRHPNIWRNNCSCIFLWKSGSFPNFLSLKG